MLPSNLKKIRVLIVDDNLSDRMILREGLKTLGFTNIQEAEDGGIAQFKYDNAFKIGSTFELVFIDLNMPHQNGMILLERLRTLYKAHLSYIIMITASSEEHNITDAIRKGIDDFIVKPLDIDTLRLKIESFVDKTS